MIRLFVQMLVYLFYAMPLMAFFTYGLRTPGCSWMLDWTIFFAGAMAQVTAVMFFAAINIPCKYSINADFPLLYPQSQWCHIGASQHSRTPYTYRVPADKWWPVITLNVLLAALPALLALRCHTNPVYFMKPVPEGQTNKEKKKN